MSTVSDEKLINIIGLLMSTYKKYVEGQIKLEPLEHTVLEEELNKPEYGEIICSINKFIFINCSQYFARSQRVEAPDPEFLPSGAAGQVRLA